VTALLVRRALWGVLTLLIVSVLVFAGTSVLSGDAATIALGKDATPERVAALRANLGLDDPAPQRYVDWLGGLLQGDLGVSLSVGTAGSTTDISTDNTGIPVSELVGDRVVNSLILAFAAAAVVFPLSLLLGAWSALRPGRRADSVISTTTLVLIALPEFVVGLLLVFLFAVQVKWFPAVSFVPPDVSLAERIDGLVLPVATLTAASVAHTARLVRGSLIEVLESDYVQMARLKGVPERAVVRRHALPNALVPTIQVVALNFAWLVGGIVIVEVVFGYPGIGQGLTAAVQSRDLPTVQVLAVAIAAVYVVVNTLADLATIVLTPRLRTAL
jgi:peptide/nickel transport system permease protein